MAGDISPANVTRLARQVYERMRSDCALPEFGYDAYPTSSLTSDRIGATTTRYANVNGTWIPTALAGGTRTDFILRVLANPAPYKWWLGTCEDLPPGHYDLQTLLLHEMLHGLGVLSLVGADRHITLGGTTAFDSALRFRGKPAVVDGVFQPAFGDPIDVEGIPIYNPPVYKHGTSLSHYAHDGVLRHSIFTNTCVRTLDNRSRTLLRAVGYDCVPLPPVDAASKLYHVQLIIAGTVLVAGIFMAYWCRSRRVSKRGKRFAV